MPLSPGDFSCGISPNEIGKAPGFDADKRHFREGFCACRLPEQTQTGSCQTVCDDIATKNLVVKDSAEGEWTCGEDVKVVENSVSGECTPGSFVYFNQGPSDYEAHLFGTQTTSGSRLGFSRSGSGPVEVFIEYSMGDRTFGCADGCDFQVTNLSVIVGAFEVPGVDAVVLKWEGLDMDYATVTLQGMLDGQIFDDGSFRLDPDGQKMISEWRGNESGNKIEELTRTIRGSVDFATGRIELDTIVQVEGDGEMRLTGLAGVPHETPPNAVISTPDRVECTSPSGAPLRLDASGTEDPQGQSLFYSWRLDGTRVPGGERSDSVSLSLGFHFAQLTARDATLGRSHVAKEILVEDTTAPEWVAPTEADFTSCDDQVDRHALVQPEVSDACTGVSEVRVFLVQANGEVFVDPIELDPATAELPTGRGRLMWVARDAAGNESAVYQDFSVGPAFLAEESFAIKDSVQVLQASGAPGALGSSGQARSELGVESLIGEIQSVGPLFLQNRAEVKGLARSAGSITQQDGTMIGFKEEYSSLIDFVSLPWLAGIATGFSGSDFSLPRGVAELPAAASGRVQVFAGARLVIPYAETRIRELWIEPGAVVEFTVPDAELVVGDKLIHRGSVEGTGTLSVFVVGSEVLVDSPVRGMNLVAPNAKLTVATTANGSRLGLLVGRTVEVQPKVTLWCDRQTRL